MASAVSSGVALGVTLVRRPILTRVADQVVEVGPLERIAAGEHHQRLAEGADLVEQAVALFGGQFLGLPLGLRGRAAMDAGEVAGLGGFPDHQQRGLVEVHAAGKCNPAASA